MTWPLTLHEFLLTWVEYDLEATATHYLKKWTGQVKSANPNVLYFLMECGGLGPTLVISLHKKIQISCQAQCLMISDPKVQKIAEKHLQREVAGR